jgi:predicted nucleic acid-binding Zn ribbon protein
MPTYVYEVVNEDGSGGERFEVFQKMTDAALTAHPQSGRPVRRVIQAPAVHTGGSALSNSNLERLGFTKYERAGDGHFEKKAGQGPNVISAD